jgi:hypothetical protein
MLMERVAKLEAENAELRARLEQNPQNSSRPRSSDPPSTPREPKGPRDARAVGSQGTGATTSASGSWLTGWCRSFRFGAAGVNVRSAVETPTRGSTR